MSNEERIVCTQCGGINRVPAGKDAHEAKCGRCAAPLFSGQPADVDGQMFQRQVDKGSLPVVVDVWAAWCGPCRMMAPEYEKAAQALEPRLRFLKLNSDKEQQVASRLNIRGIPTMIVLRDGKEIDRISGAMSASQIQNWLKPHLG